MATYRVMERRDGGDTDAEPIRDGFSLPALVFPFLWLLWHRLWLEAVVYLLIAFALISLGRLLDMGEMAALLALPLNLMVALEASTLRQFGLRRRGWQEWGAVEAGDPGEALTRYLAEAGHLDAEAQSQPELPMRYTHAAPGAPALGLFAYPDRR